MANEIRTLGKIPRPNAGDNVAIYEKAGKFVIDWPHEPPVSFDLLEAGVLLNILQKWLLEQA